MKKKKRQKKILELVQNSDSGLLSTKDLTNQFNVSEATIRRDLKELADNGFIQRQHGGVHSAQRLNQPNKGQVGLILASRIDKYRDPFYNQVLEGADRKLHELGYHPAYVRTIHDVATLQQAQTLLETFPVDGIIIMGSSQVEGIRYIRKIVPIIVSVTDMVQQNTNSDIIMFDGENGMRYVVEHLISLGYRRLGLIIGYKDSRYDGFVKTLQAFQLPIANDLLQIVKHGLEGWIPEMGERGAQTLMSLDEPPDAIVCASDRLAIGAMQWLHQKGLRIPHDIAVTGFDNIPDSEFSFPPLTTVHVHKKLLGKLAVERLIKRIENPAEIPLCITVPTSLVVRESCGQPSI